MVVNDELNEFTNIDEQEMYSLTNEFDVIGFLNGEYGDPTEWSGGVKRRFWGTKTTIGDCIPPKGRKIVKQHYVCWIKNGAAEVTFTFEPC